MNNLSQIPSQLWEGKSSQLKHVTFLFLQKIFCKSKASTENCFCSECQKIKQNQHPFILWIHPEKNYSVDHIQQIFEKIRFSLEKNQSFFFVLEKVNTLNKTCANRLLKILEEPPPGYKFLLLTNNIEIILPTIRSRCLIKHFHSKNSNINPFVLYFLDENKLYDPLNFLSELKKANLSDNESFELAGEILTHFTNHLVKLYKSQTTKNQNEIINCEKIISYLKTKMSKPPQSGSSNIFWKNLYLNFPRK
jgi:DNA polymerase III delta prime subunit